MFPILEVPDTLQCFTDGSLLEGHSGAGVYLPQENTIRRLRVPLGRFATVFQAEICATATGASFFLQQEVRDKNILFYSDSQAALRALLSPLQKTVTVPSCIDVLNQLGQNNTVTISWIPGHSGHVGNEVADECARLASTILTQGPQPHLPVAIRHCNRQVLEWVSLNHSRQWLKLTSCRQAKEN